MRLRRVEREICWRGARKEMVAWRAQLWPSDFDICFVVDIIVIGVLKTYILVKLGILFPP